MPRGVHPTEVVRGIGRSHQGADLALGSVEGRQTGQPLSDCRNGFSDQVDDDFSIAVLRLLLRSVRGRHQRCGGGVHVLLVPRDHFVSQDCAQNGLKKKSFVTLAQVVIYYIKFFYLITYLVEIEIESVNALFCKHLKKSEEIYRLPYIILSDL